MTVPHKKAPKNLVVRSMEPVDAESVARLSQQKSVYMGTLRTPYESVAATAQNFQANDPNRLSVVAELQGVIVGQASVTLGRRERQRHLGYVGMMVHEKHQGRGVGGALLDALIDYSDNWAQLLRLELDVFVDNKAALGLYRSRGFEIEGIARAFAIRDGVYTDAFRMARVLPNLPHPRLTAEDVASRRPQLPKSSSATAPKKKPGGGTWGSGRGSA